MFYITFLVMEIEPAYTCLLRRPWIHAAGAVTSTLHQKMKFLVEGRLVVIYNEEDIFVCHIESNRYISVDEDCIATLFQVLGVALMVTLKKVKKPNATSWRDLQIAVESGT